ncbi:PTS transporter subunit IIABC [Mycoplasmopsis edwardii]|uniref:Glucose PTS transporter subunit IIA n=1 Tax=Mycoplasmopsis edwardii TaxID=53558 RepID=A0ACD4PH05_9BACT|nr:PTS transporter subunit IIABC [Mycoplasmopsis edwardii]WBP83917.1 glucose PTS transporter subunit IIA [Mycoplasmopsis edwardii]
MFSITKKHSIEKKEKKLNNSNSGRLRRVLSKISGAFMLPISVMSIAGLFLGVGAAVAGIDSTNTALVTFGHFIKALGDPVFAALPLLFAIAFVIAFTDEAGIAVFATVIGYLVFSAIQSVFIQPVYSDPEKTNLSGYTILFEEGGRNHASLKSTVGLTLGIRTLQTSVFGGISVGLIVQYLYKKFHTIKLPQVISFFGGKRFVSIITIPTMAALAFVFLLFWPWIGVGLNAFGNALNKAPYGLESFVFGFIERSLIPFGLHHAFYAPLWYSNAGGNVGVAVLEFVNQPGIKAGDSLNALVEAIKLEGNKFVGDSTAALSLLKFANTIEWTDGDGVKHSVPLFEFIQNVGVKLGRFTDGKFSFMIFGLPAAGLAMVMAAPKETRKIAFGTVLPAAITSLTTGVTEPIEFTFLFLAPYLFWGFHAIMCAFSFMFANLLSVHVPQAFSGGLLDLLLYGIIPFAKGTNFYWTLVIGLGYAPIYFFVFYFVIKWKDLATPGRGGNVKLFSKADFINKNNETSNEDEFKDLDKQALAIVQGYGGIDNIVAFNNCASRLRYDIKDASKVDQEALKNAGAVAVKFEGNTHAQAILGPSAEQVNAKIKSQRDLIAKWEQANKTSTKPVVEEKPLVEAKIKNETQEQKNEDTIIDKRVVKVQTVAIGDILNLEELKDDVFSARLMGDGFAIKFQSEKVGNVYAPVSGEITMVYPSKHAYGIETKEGAKVLVHIGIDTVKLDGKGFKSYVQEGTKVKAGDKLASVDLGLLKKNKIKSDVVVIILNEGSKNQFTLEEGKNKAYTKSELIGKIR